MSPSAPIFPDHLSVTHFSVSPYGWAVGVSLYGADSMPDLYSAEYLAARRAALLGQDGFAGIDATNPTGPSGHPRGIATSARLTSEYRRVHRSQAMDITPQQVMETLQQARIENWVLMGLHGYVGYLPEPRATQDVDVLVPYNAKARVVQAISGRWPTLEIRELSQVVRFIDPGEVGLDGTPQVVIDVMLPWSPFQESILKEHVIVDPTTGHRLPTLEAAVVSKYAALVSPHRDTAKKEYDAGDLRRIIRANHNKIDHQVIESLGNQVWEQGGAELLAFLDIALEDKPFPI